MNYLSRCTHKYRGNSIICGVQTIWKYYQACCVSLWVREWVRERQKKKSKLGRPFTSTRQIILTIKESLNGIDDTHLPVYYFAIISWWVILTRHVRNVNVLINTCELHNFSALPNIDECDILWTILPETTTIGDAIQFCNGNYKHLDIDRLEFNHFILINALSLSCVFKSGSFLVVTGTWYSRILSFRHAMQKKSLVKRIE